MNIPHLSYENFQPRLDWAEAVEALRKGHLGPKSEVADMFLGPSTKTLLSRGAYIDGLGYGVKSVTIFDVNAAQGKPTTNGAMVFFEPEFGEPIAFVDYRLVTDYKTASDSVLGARLLANKQSKHLLILGAGNVASNLINAYPCLFPSIEKISIWARRAEQSQELVNACAHGKVKVEAVDDLAAAASTADIISTTTMTRTPILRGEWIMPGTHIDLIGAYKADMREADDVLLKKSKIFVDNRDTTIHHIGELKIPISEGVITQNDILADLYDLIGSKAQGRQSSDEITLFKNGGGAHLDLMMAHYIASKK